jgi:hypothetical protein
LTLSRPALPAKQQSNTMRTSQEALFSMGCSSDQFNVGLPFWRLLLTVRIHPVLWESSWCGWNRWRHSYAAQILLFLCHCPWPP